jgi:hypothetical protein
MTECIRDPFRQISRVGMPVLLRIRIGDSDSITRRSRSALLRIRVVQCPDLAYGVPKKLVNPSNRVLIIPSLSLMAGDMPRHRPVRECARPIMDDLMRCCLISRLVELVGVAEDFVVVFHVVDGLCIVERTAVNFSPRRNQVLTQ